ncbi:MAG: hypothetical protein QOE91_1459, partial [Gaiellaceae bacterium]|nr:hypothetical protein [Gaiellaceae bacterium]
IAARSILAPPSTLSDAVTTLLSALSYRTQSWSRHAPVIPDPPDSQQYL